LAGCMDGWDGNPGKCHCNEAEVLDGGILGFHNVSFGFRYGGRWGNSRVSGLIRWRKMKRMWGSRSERSGCRPGFFGGLQGTACGATRAIRRYDAHFSADVSFRRNERIVYLGRHSSYQGNPTPTGAGGTRQRALTSGHAPWRDHGLVERPPFHRDEEAAPPTWRLEKPLVEVRAGN